MPSIHVGFRDLAPGTLAATTRPFSCQRFITIDSNGAWNYGTPEDAGGAGHYIAGRNDSKGNVYFRIAFQHDLLRAFGVGATPDVPTRDNRPDDAYS